MVFIIPGVAASGYPGVEATGGTITTYSSGGITYKVHTFSSVGTTNFVVSANGTVDYLIIGGGGSGGAGRASPFTEWPGGGGAGGFVEGTFNVTTGTTYPIVVGAGGAGVSAFSPNEAPRDGNNGADSTAFNKTAIGGGAGASPQPRTGKSGGSGGGAAGRQDATPNNAYNSGGSGLQPGSASGGFGNGGGGSINDSTNIRGGGGGGGAGGGGSDGALGGGGGAGGSGKDSSITGTTVRYSAGGAGAGGSNGSGYGNPGSGTAGLRGGGTTVNGFNGIVIVRYQLF